MSHKILIADDDGDTFKVCLPVYLTDLKALQIDYALTVKESLKMVQEENYEVILLDISFPTGAREGISLISQIRAISPGSHIIMLTALDDCHTVKQCMELGANDFASKNSHPIGKLIAERIRLGLKHRERTTCTVETGKKLADKVGAIITSKGMFKVFQAVAMVRSDTKMHVLISGPTGVGKEMVARAIAREELGAPYVRLNSACFSDELIEGELFGHERGAFTNADRLKPGLFEVANGGDIFFDEVAELSLAAQAKLLRVLQCGEFLRVGGTKILKTTARVIAATNENLEDLVKKGKFRLDLLKRLQQLTIEIPALKYRNNEIRPLVFAIIKRSSFPESKVSEDLMVLLESYSWPGNVRELENTVRSALLSANGQDLTIGHLPMRFFSAFNPQDSTESTLEGSENFNFVIKVGEELFNAQNDFAKKFIKNAARRLRVPITYGSLAKALGVPKSTLISRMNALGLSFEELVT